MTPDWHDSLASLRDSLPEGADSPPATPEEAPENSKTEKICIAYERKGRGGKQVTIVYGFQCSDDGLQKIASQLKKELATGGSARAGEILIQGDRRQDVARALKRIGYKDVRGE